MHHRDVSVASRGKQRGLTVGLWHGGTWPDVWSRKPGLQETACPADATSDGAIGTDHHMAQPSMRRDCRHYCCRRQYCCCCCRRFCSPGTWCLHHLAAWGFAAAAVPAAPAAPACTEGTAGASCIYRRATHHNCCCSCCRCFQPCHQPHQHQKQHYLLPSCCCCCASPQAVPHRWRPTWQPPATRLNPTTALPAQLPAAGTAAAAHATAVGEQTLLQRMQLPACKIPSRSQQQQWHRWRSEV